MTDRLQISDQVKAHLAPEDLAGLVRARGHTELKCFVCEDPILPESKEKATVSLFSDPTEGVLVAKVAHSGCAPSEFNVVDLPREVMVEAGSGSISYLQAVIPLPGPTAAIFWEQNLSVTVRDGEGNLVYPYLESYQADGFTPDERIPFLDRWEFGFEGNDLALLRDGERVERFNAALESAPVGWFDAIENTGVCLALVGVGLGLDRFDPAQLEKARVEDRTVAGVIRVSDIPDASSDRASSTD